MTRYRVQIQHQKGVILTFVSEFLTFIINGKTNISFDELHVRIKMAS